MPTPTRRSSLARAPATALTTGALCAAAGVTRGALRIYEREGLLGVPRRSGAGYRQFADDAVARLQAIRLLREIGFSLREIGVLLAEQHSGDLDAAHMQALAREQLDVIDARVARLQQVRHYMAAVAAGNVGLIDDPECRFLVDFLAAGNAAEPGHRAEPHQPHQSHGSHDSLQPHPARPSRADAEVL